MRGVKKSWPKVLYSPSLHLQRIIAESTLASMVAYEVICATCTCAFPLSFLRHPSWHSLWQKQAETGRVGSIAAPQPREMLQAPRVGQRATGVEIVHLTLRLIIAQRLSATEKAIPVPPMRRKHTVLTLSTAHI